MAAAVNGVVPPGRFLPVARPPAAAGELNSSRCRARCPSSQHTTQLMLKGLPGSSLPPFRRCGTQPQGAEGTRKLGGGGRRGPNRAVGSMREDPDLIPVQSSDCTDWQEEAVVAREWEEGCAPNRTTSSVDNQVGSFAFQRGGVGDVSSFSSAAAPSSSSSSSCLQDGEEEDREDLYRLVDRSINATIVLAAGTFAITKLLTIDHDYWHGWTLYEIVRYAPLHNWTAYEEALKMNPVLAKMMISGVVYSLGDWIAQCYEGKPLFEFNRTRMFRSGLVGFTLHGSLSHYYYQFCEALFPYQEWWVLPAKVAFDQTAWAALWNSIYYIALGFLRFESPSNIFGELQATFWPMLTAGWKLWPFAHLITYGVIPVEQRLLWVDCVELIWVTILSTYSNEKSEARHSEATIETGTSEVRVDEDNVADHR